MLWTPLALILQQRQLMKLLNKQGQTTHKFSFLTAEQKPWQTLSDFMSPLFLRSWCVVRIVLKTMQ